MKYCWSIHNRQSPLMPACVILLALMSIPEILGQNSDELRLKMSVLFLALFWGPAFWAFISARQYKIESDGMTVKYPFGYIRKYRWSAFSEIALCKIHYSARGTNPTLAIRCVIGKESFGPANASASNEWWSTAGYEVIHFRRVISVYCTAERYTEFLKCCPHPIEDYRYLRDHL